jgi:hypothetical protein
MFWLIKEPAQNVPGITRATQGLAGSFPVWWHAAVPFALLSNSRKTVAELSARRDCA